jgi:ABC-2 type transport system ATP-binding protein
MCTLLVPDSGKITIKDMDVTKEMGEIRKILGYMPQKFSLYQDLSVEQNIRFFADLFQVKVSDREERLNDLYKFSRLGQFKKRKAAALSGGMKQKLALSCALVHTPEILILDEPTFGVDPLSRQEFWQLLKTIKSRGTTIVVSTAYMDEAELCERIALFFKGKIVGMGTPESLKQNYPFPVYKIAGSNLHVIQDFFKSEISVNTCQMFGDSLHVSFREKPSEDTWLRWKGQTGEGLESWTELSPGIEDVFLDLMKEPS